MRLLTVDRRQSFHPSTLFEYLLIDRGKRRAARQRARERVF